MRFVASVLFLLCVTTTLAQNYDFYVLATEWAGTVCGEKKCNYAAGINTNFFNLHGLWPSLFSQPMGPFNCDNVPFSSNYFTPNTASLNKQYWSGLYSSADDFHSHEWEKHGSCWVNDLKQVNPVDDFFRKAISLATKYNAFNALTNAGVTPGRTYATNDVVSVLSSALKPNSFGLICSKNRLQEIRICLDRNYEVIACPTSVRTIKCNGNVEFPTLSL